MSATRPAVLPPPIFHERLWPSRAAWLLVPGFAAMTGVVLIPVGPVPSVGVGVAVLLLLVGSLAWTSPEIAVYAGARPAVKAGRAMLPLAHVRAVEALNSTRMREVLGPAADARSYLVHRGWVHTGARLVLADPRDPTPSWVVSTRRPEEFVACVLRASQGLPDPGEGQAAHSEQTN